MYDPIMALISDLQNDPEIAALLGAGAVQTSPEETKKAVAEFVANLNKLADDISAGMKRIADGKRIPFGTFSEEVFKANSDLSTMVSEAYNAINLFALAAEVDFAARTEAGF